MRFIMDSARDDLAIPTALGATRIADSSPPYGDHIFPLWEIDIPDLPTLLALIRQASVDFVLRAALRDACPCITLYDGYLE